MATKIPSIPIRSQVVDDTGILTATWVMWYQTVFARLGGSIAESNTELAQTTGSTGATVTALQANVNTLNSQVAALQSGFGVGRFL